MPVSLPKIYPMYKKATPQQGGRGRMPVQQWIFSWQEGEQPTRGQVDEAVDIFLGHMGLTGHQTVYALHYDTDNYHLHIAVNRMNEETGKVVQPHKGFDIDAAHRILALIEHRQGWKTQEKVRYVVLENGELARRKNGREIKPRQAALDVEHATGEKSAQRIAQERGMTSYGTQTHGKTYTGSWQKSISVLRKRGPARSFLWETLP